jgi:hypothetical protein
MENVTDTEYSSEGGSVCPACAAYIGPNEVFCPECRAPISLLANTDPLQRIYAEGYMYSRVVSSRPKLVVVIGIWVIFGPLAAFSLFGVFSVMSDGLGSGGMGFIFFWGMMFLAVFSIVMLFRVTRNYLSPPDTKTED